jgi:fructoselysine-6-P-deglycase FrlB-like protein
MHYIYSKRFQLDCLAIKLASTGGHGYIEENGVVVLYSQSGNNVFSALELARAKFPDFTIIGDLRDANSN